METIFRKRRSDHLDEKTPQNSIVRLMGTGSRAPETPVERLAVSALQREGAITLELLVQRVASDLFSEELRNGAWALDIGLFGSRLFIPDVVREIQAANGALWRIEK